MSLGERGQQQLGVNFESSVVTGVDEESTNGRESSSEPRTVKMWKEGGAV